MPTERIGPEEQARHRRGQLVRPVEPGSGKGLSGISAAAALVFVATDERPLVLAALDSVFASRPASPIEAVVVDNASSDGTREEVARRWPEVSVLTRHSRGWLQANLNVGIRSTTAPYVMLCNSDIVFPPGSIDRLVEFLQYHPGAGMAAPKLLSPSGEVSPSARRWYTLRSLVALRCPGVSDRSRFPSVRHSLYADWDGTGARSVDWVHCPATLLRRAALDEVGLLDERFKIYFGDVDLSLRMHERGWEVWCVPDAEVVHRWRRASRTPLSRAWFIHLDSLVRFLLKHRSLRPRSLPTLAHRRQGSTGSRQVETTVSPAGTEGLSTTIVDGRLE